MLSLHRLRGGEDSGAAADPPGAGTTTSRPHDDVAPAPTDADDPTPRTAPATPPPTRPDWLGTRVLPDGAPPPPTPPELDPRLLPTVDALPPPADGAFHAEVQAVPADVVARSTWQEGCPVTLDELRYVTVSFWGFDDAAHTGELIVHRDAADGMVGVFEQLFAERFPIEDMRVSTMADLDAPNTGDGNTTAAFVCRPTRGGSRWSEHAYGLAVDVNPFQNPYSRRRRDPGPGRQLPRPGQRATGHARAGRGPIEAFAAHRLAVGRRLGEPARLHALQRQRPVTGRAAGRVSRRGRARAGAASTRRDHHEVGGAVARHARAPRVDHVAAVAPAEERRHGALLLVGVRALDGLHGAVTQDHLERRHAWTVRRPRCAEREGQPCELCGVVHRRAAPAVGPGSARAGSARL